MGIELLAPAGDWDCLEAAVRAGADAVYFGFGHLNARRRAKNFTEQQARQAVEFLHAHGVRAYLTLNIDLATRELGLAVEMLRTASEAGFDAVLVRDPGLLAVREAFPHLEFHFSTQTCMANSADVEAARELGAQRVVLAREMTLEEIAAASQTPGIRTEVFAQGALCFSVSGRCLMSSWVGGRSGNRGLCASPCRAPWSVDGEPVGHPLSMHDLCTLDWLSRLEAVGVSALKIEGRLKSPAWTEKAVRIYRRALAGEPVEPLKQQAQRLTEYTGRAFTDGYLAGRRADLTGTDRGRQPRHEEISPPGAAEMEASLEHSAEAWADEEVSAGGSGRTFRFLLSSRGPTISCHLWVDQVEVCWQYPKSVVHRAYRAISAGAVCEELQGCRIQGMLVESAVTDDPEFLLVRRTANAMVSRIAAELGRLQRAAARPITLTLPAESAISEAELVSASVNIRTLGDPPNGVRLHKTQLEEFVRHERQALLIVEGVDPEDVSWLVQVCRKQRPVVALPAVCFEEDLPAIRELVARCKKARLTVEVNSWGGWWIARRAGIAFETGPGLGVLNPLGAGMLRKLGARSVTVSLEADRRQLEDLCGAAPVGLSLYVFGRPVLATTRAEFPSEFQKRVLADRRGLRMTARRERGLWVFRPENAFDWRRLRNERIRVKNLVVDLVASPDPMGEWLHVLPRGGRGAFYFNYHRTLQ